MSAETSNSPPPAVRRAVGWRSILLGLAGVVFICAVTPYNDYVVNNTFMVGNFLPVGVVLAVLALVMVVNAPLWRFFPRLALSTGELAVAVSMMLVSCTLPSSGLMRYLPGHLVGLYYQAGNNVDLRDNLAQVDPPSWVFPKFASGNVLDRSNSPVVREFVGRVPVEQNTFAAHWRAVPWAAWRAPAIGWAILLAMLYGAVLFLSVLLRHQWEENERLPFPLASVYLSLVEAPERGRGLNALFHSRAFWVACLLVFFLHSFNAMHAYLPRYFPQIPTGYSLWELFGNAPLSYTDWGLRAASIYFCIVGITFFIQTKIAFSIWFFYILMQFIKCFTNSAFGLDITDPMKNDQTLGAMTVVTLGILWVGRRHWMTVLGQMARGARGREARERYAPYAVAGWGLMVCLAGMAVWLRCAGVSWGAAVNLVLMLMMLFLVLARVVAETGLIFVQFGQNVSLDQPLIYAFNGLGSAISVRTTVKSYFWTCFFSSVFAHDPREALSPFASNALRLGDIAEYDHEPKGRRAPGFLLCLGLALAVGYVVSGASMLYTEYTYASTIDRHPTPIINTYGVLKAPLDFVGTPVQKYVSPGGPVATHNRVGHLVLGAAVTSVLSVLRMRYASWPLHPLGYLLVYSYPLQVIWFSVMIGWLAKVLVVNMGGMDLFRRARGFFIGLIVGEVGAATVWLVVSLVMTALGKEYVAIRLLPS